MEHKDLTEKIIACAYRVFNKMGSGFLESVYEKCLKIELIKNGLIVEFQKAIQVFMTKNRSGSLLLISL